jgi:hypothetical protein
LLFDRLMQAVDPADLLVVENVTLNFNRVLRTSLGEIEVKRTPDSLMGRKNKDKKKEKEKEKKKMEGKYTAREDVKVMGKGRWRKINRPVADFIHHEELASFSQAMRNVRSHRHHLTPCRHTAYSRSRSRAVQAATTEATKSLETQIAVLKEQLSAEREVRNKVETQLSLARSHIAQEAAKREGQERLLAAMLEKLKSAGIAFTPPPSPSPTPAVTHNNISSSPPTPGAHPGSKSGTHASLAQPFVLTRHNSSPNKLLSAKLPAASQRESSSSQSLSPLSAQTTKQAHTSPREHQKISPRAGSSSKSSSSGSQSATTSSTPTSAIPPAVGPRVRQSSGGGSLIATAYQNSGRPLMAVDDGQSGQSLTDRLVDKMFSVDCGLELRETRDGRLCFCGCECVDWLVEELRVGRDKAVAIGEKLLSRGFFRCLVYEVASFTDDRTLYQATVPTDADHDV